MRWFLARRAREGAGRVPTVPIYGDYLLTEEQWEQVTEWGAVCEAGMWRSPEGAVEQVRAVLLPRTCEYARKYSELSARQQYHLRFRFPETRYRVQGDDLFLLASAAGEIRTAFRLS